MKNRRYFKLLKVDGKKKKGNQFELILNLSIFRMQSSLFSKNDFISCKKSNTHRVIGLMI